MRCVPSLDFLCRIFEAVIKAGAKTPSMCPDTVGYNIPGQFAERIRS
jgi:2-isopropylmalate synthase